MKKFLCIMLGVLCVLSLFGCSKENENDALMRIPAEVSNINDFKCVCSTDNETEFLIEGESAKELYTYIWEKQRQAEQTEIDRTEQNYIYLSFQDGEPLYSLNQQTKTSDALAGSERHFYGVFWIHENDYMVYTAMPMTSFQSYYKLPEGTYNKVLEMITR